MKDIHTVFEEKLKSRNKEQLEAITATEGPVMVIAGPGTGKTDVLSLRAGYILNNTDADPQNILCLTYTDAGVVSMRRRLKQYIGSAAYQVHINTFHSFCNDIIRSHRELFGLSRELQPIDELERVEVLQKIIDELPFNHVLYRREGQGKYSDLQRLKSLFDLMKAENWSIDYAQNQVDKAIEDQKLNGISSRGPSKGQLTVKAKGKIKSLEGLKAAISLYDRYVEICAQMGRYDYNDMILWVINAFKQNEELLLAHQEQFQYIMVDEFQDTNGAQLELVNILSSYWDQPNLFVVGDDDQAIYRFQGADMSNITQFIQKYQPKQIVLDKNYRSSQSILDTATALIKNNKGDRLIPNKELIAEGPHAKLPPDITIASYDSDTQEYASVTEKLVELYNSGKIKDAESVGLIYVKHAQGEPILNALQAEGVPVELKRKTNVLQEPLGRQLIQILRYVQKEIEKPYSGEYLLAEILYYRFFQLSALDIRLLHRERQRRKAQELPKRHYLDLLTDTEWIDQQSWTSKKDVVQLGYNLMSWQEKHNEDTLQVFFERIISYGGILEFVLKQPQRGWYLRIIHTIMEYIKAQSAKDHAYSLARCIQEIDEHYEHNISMPIRRILRAEAGVQMMTAHGSKGLEFDHVFIIHATHDGWKKRNSNSGSFSMPEQLQTIRDEEGVTDVRRLFYVAMTRARKSLHISYHESKNDKNQEKNQFILEIESEPAIQHVTPTVDADFAYGFISNVWTQWPQDSGIFDKELIKDKLETFTLSVTGLNKYLRCPTAFYFENILRIPQARTVSTGFGLAIHYALEHWIESPTKDNVQVLLDYFDQGMRLFRSHFNDKEFTDRTQYGHDILSLFYKQYGQEYNYLDTFHTEYAIKNVVYKDIPISGNLDFVRVLSDSIEVTDFKTGKPENATRKLATPFQKRYANPEGGDYWRQIVFYKLLIDADPRLSKPMRSGKMHFIQPKKDESTKVTQYDLEQQDVDFVGEQIQTAYRGIMNHEFERGCQDEKCTWCNLLKDQFKIQGILPQEFEE